MGWQPQVKCDSGNLGCIADCRASRGTVFYCLKESRERSRAGDFVRQVRDILQASREVTKGLT